MTAKKDNFGDVLERQGVKYFIGVSVFLYVLGTVIFNIYLRKLGSFEFDLLQLRYMFVGLAFVLITSVFPLSVWGTYGIIRLFRGGEPELPKRLAPMQKAKITRERNEKKRRTFNRWQTVFLIFLPIWMGTYAWLVFPEIPSGFGGAKPYAARLIGTEEAIQKINDQIAFEAGVQSEKLPFEVLPGASGLTTGANVLILDKSDSRIFLLLTRDIYLSSTSNFAKKMIALGEIPENLETGDAKNFLIKPLIVSAEGIDGITLSLYNPPEITTTEDLQLAAEILAAAPKSAEAITEVISSELPGVGEKIVAAVKKHQEEQPATSSAEPGTPSVVVPPITLEEVITEVIAESVDTAFLDFRAIAFSQAGNLISIEKREGTNPERRRQLIQTITKNFEDKFAEAWATLDPNTNFLANGQQDLMFPRKIQSAFRGAEDAMEIMRRLNDTEVEKENTYLTVQTAAREVVSSASVDTPENRDLVSDNLIALLNREASDDRLSWTESYINLGKEDTAYLSNLTTLFTTPTTWTEFVTQSTTFIDEINTEPEPTCTDEVQNGDETGVDCGGSCDACVVAETCDDGILNQDEIAIDCGGSCDACVVAETCEDGILNQDETAIDCGGVCDACVAAETCEDGILNQDETGVDCGGVCDACVVAETCEDGILNQDETAIDCGGACEACPVAETCSDGILNQDETAIDCGGVCEACVVSETCEDGILNQDETEIDCGGTVCNSCPA